MSEEQKNERLVCIVSSNDKHCKGMKAVLGHFCEVSTHHGSFETVKNISGKSPNVIVVDEEITLGSSVDFIRALQGEEELQDVPIVITISLENKKLIEECRALGAESYIIKPLTRGAIIKSVTHHLSAAVEKQWEALPETQREALQGTVHVFSDIADVLAQGEAMPYKTVEDSCEPLVKAIEANDFTPILDGVRDHDDYTYAHSMRVASMLTLLGAAAGFKKDDQLLLASGGLLHDVGKMKIPHHILNKPGRLDDDEFEIIKTHVPHTVEYLEGVEGIPKPIFIIAEQHHEKIDGTGYPHGLGGKELNELARMAAIVDVFSALTDKRIYKPAMPASKAMTIMTEEMDNHLDQHYVKMFRSILIDSGVLS